MKSGEVKSMRWNNKLSKRLAAVCGQVPLLAGSLPWGQRGGPIYSGRLGCAAGGIAEGFACGAHEKLSYYYPGGHLSTPSNGIYKSYIYTEEGKLQTQTQEAEPDSPQDRSAPGTQKAEHQAFRQFRLDWADTLRKGEEEGEAWGTSDCSPGRLGT